MEASSQTPTATCVECQAPYDPAALYCPACNALTHSAELEALAGQAKAAESRSDWSEALSVWRQCLLLLPPHTKQYAVIEAKIAELETKAQEAEAAKETNSKWYKRAAALGPIGILLWKFKVAILLVLTKGKLLLLGLTKMSTLLSMFLSAGVYWALYGWKFAFGLVLSIYVHEMGHVFALRRYGIPADAPMFIPGLGAFIRLRRLSITPIQDSRIGLAGPIYGWGAAVFCLAAYFITGAKAWAAIAHFGAMINLFNLIPIWQLDGSRGFQSLTKRERIFVVATAGLIWILMSEPMLLLIAVVGGFRLFQGEAAKDPDPVGLRQFLLLLAGLAITEVISGSFAR